MIGALESAVRGVYQFLFQHSKNSTNIVAALEAYHKSEISTPYGPLPAEFDRIKNVTVAVGKGNKANKTRIAAYVEWARQRLLFETILLKQKRDLLDLAKVTADEVAPLLDAEVKSTALKV